MLLMILALTEANDIQKNTEPQEAIPQTHVVTYIDAKPTASTDTTNFLSTQWAVPIHFMGELPGYHSHHSKPKCLQNIHRQNYYNSIHDAEAMEIRHQRTNIHFHVIDYYIYTLEHILI